MARTIKLLVYYFAYQLAVMGVFVCGYMLFHHTTEIPPATAPAYLTLILLAQVISTLGIGIHLLAGRYVPLDRQTWACHHPLKLLPASVLLILGIAFWSNYLNELADLPNTMQETFETIMRHPLGILAVVILAPIVEELLFRGAIQGHLLRKWKHPLWAILVSSLLFGLVHGNWVQAPFAFVVGLSLGWIYYHSGSLLPGIVMHFVNNGTAVLSFWMSGQTDATMISTFGPVNAACIAAGGAVLTVICIYYIRIILPFPAKWKEKIPAS